MTVSSFTAPSPEEPATLSTCPAFVQRTDCVTDMVKSEWSVTAPQRLQPGQVRQRDPWWHPTRRGVRGSDNQGNWGPMAVPPGSPPSGCTQLFIPNERWCPLRHPVAWQDETACDGMNRAKDVGMPGEMAAHAAIDEVPVHGWDIAAATGHAYPCETQLIKAAYAYVQSAVHRTRRGARGCSALRYACQTPRRCLTASSG